MEEIRNANGLNYFKSKGNFQISVDPEMFRIFSSGLYSNPIKAIVREYYTNGYDSQKEAGVDRPIDVQLPTKSDPTFMVRDYGTGISPENVETIYKTYGASTKRDTNLATGKFGLGAKCALSYVSSFGVVSYYNGKMHKYLVELNEEGVPELFYSGDPTDTDEPSGLKVQFSVDVNDVKKFTEAAQETYKYFDLLPNFIGDNKPEILPPEYMMEGDEGRFKWKVKYRSDRWEESHIIMGGNCYPVGDDLSNFRHEGIDYYVEMDTYEPTPSRESINWTNEDVRKFKGMRDVVRKRIYQRVQEETKGFTDWEKFHYVSKYEDTAVYSVLSEKRDSYLGYTKLTKPDDKLFTIRVSSRSLDIESESVTIRSVWPSTSNGHHILRKSSGSYKKGELGGASVATKEVTKGNPLSIILYDKKGIKDYLEDIPRKTIVFGEGCSPDNEKYLKELTDRLDAQRIPYTVKKLSEVMSATPITKSRKVSLVDSDNDLDVSKCVGAFEFMRGQFVQVRNISAFTHYVPFDDERTFELDKFFDASTKGASYHSQHEKLIAIKLRQISYYKIFTALDLKEDFKVCYIRPRFVKQYATKLKPLKEVCYNRLKEKFEHNWQGFMAMLYGDSTYYNADTDRNCDIFSKEVQTFFDKIQRTDRNSWLEHYVRCPFIAQILETVTKYRWNWQHLRYVTQLRSCSGDYVDRSEEANSIANDYYTLTYWMFPVATFVEFYADWINRLNEEMVSLSRTYPYLFKSKTDLLFNSLIYRRPNKCQLTTLT